MEANQVAPGLQIQFLVAKKCKSDKVYRKTCDVLGEACFNKKKNFTKWLTVGLPSKLCQKDSTWSGNTLALR